MTTANLNPQILSWARERLDLSVSEFAKKLGKTAECLTAWEIGEKLLTFNQAMHFAKQAHIPLGYLFLPEPPIEKFPLPDLRTLHGSGVHQPSAELIDLVKLMLQRQEWYKEYLRQQIVGPNQIVGSFSNNADVDGIVVDMQEKLRLITGQRGRNDWQSHYRDLVAKIEAAGILVMRQAYLGHPTRRLDVTEFRGFAITDEYAPLIFVNQADAPGACLFTLIHELCHIWIGQSGISDGDTTTVRHGEKLCNAVAAEFLVPKKEFTQRWQNLEDWQENLTALEPIFHVSKWVLARRALSCGYISTPEYERFITAQQDAYRSRESAGKGGPTYYRTKKAQISERFSKAVVGQALNSQILLRDAGQLLGMKPSNVAKFAQELQL